MSLRSPLGRVLGLGTAKDGTAHFLAQRVTAVALAILGSWFVVSLAGLEAHTYLDVIRFLRNPVNGILLVLTFATLCYHSYLGVQVVIEDYVHGPGAKLAALVLSRFAHVLLAVAAVVSILDVGLSS